MTDLDLGDLLIGKTRVPSYGNKEAKIVFLGEAPGAQEEMLRMPFVGPAGQILWGPLKELGITRQDVYTMNVFSFRPSGNNKAHFCCPKRDLPKDYDLPPLDRGLYVRPEYIELDRIKAEIEEVHPNVAVALGNTACWALLGRTGITKIRGYITESTLVPGLKVLPTLHPSNIQRGNWTERPTFALDIQKAVRESEHAAIRVQSRLIKIPTNVGEVGTALADCARHPLTSVDVETFGGQIEFIAFSPKPDLAYVIKFFDQKTGESAWSREDEIAILRLIRAFMTDPTSHKLYQNGVYDLQYHWMSWGMPVMGAGDDTMLLHHAIQPEAKKGLGYLGSIHTDQPQWKHLRKAPRTKREA